MSRRDYIVISDILASYKDLIGDEFVFQDLVEDFADFLSTDNPKFKFDKFREACNK